jgi:hypothetical protein
VVKRPVTGSSGCILTPSPHPATKKQTKKQTKKKKKRKKEKRRKKKKKEISCISQTCAVSLFITQVACHKHGTNNFSYISKQHDARYTMFPFCPTLHPVSRQSLDTPKLLYRE